MAKKIDIKTIQDLANFVNLLAVKNRKENGIYNTAIASLSGILITELNRVNEFLEEQDIIGLAEWKLLSQEVVNIELNNLHPSVNLNELYEVNIQNSENN